MTRTAQRISIGHHAQGPVVILLAVLPIVYGSVPMGVALAGYLAMHFCYGGAGTFQRPLRADKRPGVVDILIVAVGVSALAAYVCLLVAVPARALFSTAP